MLLGDLNSRTGKLPDHVLNDDNDFIPCNSTRQNRSFIPRNRNNCDNIINTHGKLLIDFCKCHDLCILNGRVRGDSLGNFTFHCSQGSSTVDYMICDQHFFSQIDYKVAPRD